MKMFNLLFIIGFVLVLTACGDDTQMQGDKAASGETALEHAEKHMDPTYVCPMHPQIVKDEPGNCPICGMDLVKKEPEPQQQGSGEKKILYWVAPMDPSYRRDAPGKSPMGMDLVPVYDEGGGLSVKISPVVENNLGVRTAKAERNTLWRKIDTVGYVDFDETKISHVHLRTKGWIEKLYVESEGERVKKGQLLFEVYSPELVTAQEEYVQALGSGHKGLIRASRERLIALGISEQQIETLHNTRRVNQYVSSYASQDGIVAKLGVREGMYVMPQFEVMALADLSSIWIQAEIFESQVDWVKRGQPADVELSYYPGRTWEGKLQYVYPSLNPKTRTLKVRLQFDNPDETLKPNMFANVTIYGGPKRDVVVIPSEALIRTGEEQRVILAMGDGKYQPRKVVAGMESGGWVEIQRGLSAGDTVVTSGQFLIDSEASLKASLQRMSASSGESMTMPMKKVQPITGTGVLRELMPDDGKIKMSHDPIPALGWPEMTMPFKVKPEVALDKFKPDDKVEFELEQSDDGYVITSMQKQAGE